MGTLLRTGIDLVEIARLERIDPHIRLHFDRRVFTPAELAEAAGRPETLAGKYAVKEAAAKALGCGIGLVRWQDIETLNGPAGEPCLALHGSAARLAHEQGLSIWSVSISHTATHAVAVVVALGIGPD
ncbi:MAG: holo-ACP synthase [Chloroflexi bacterium]|nr:holo-ACP synthase [Chloroflexota bacterium]